MTEPALRDAAAFKPLTDGDGLAITVTTTASAPAGIPGTAGAGEANNIVRLRIANTGSSNACIRFGVTANLNCIEILSGTVEMFTVPYSPNGVSLSAICRSGTTVIQATAGVGY